MLPDLLPSRVTFERRYNLTNNIIKKKSILVFYICVLKIIKIVLSVSLLGNNGPGEAQQSIYLLSKSPRQTEKCIDLLLDLFSEPLRQSKVVLHALALLSHSSLWQSALLHPSPYRAIFRHALRDCHKFADSYFFRKEVPVLCQQIRRSAQCVGERSWAEYWRLGMDQYACIEMRQKEIWGEGAFLATAVY